MSFLFPKIDSKNPKEAWRAFCFVKRSDEEMDMLLRREDIVIRDQIFERALQFRPKLIGKILHDPSHPYYPKVKKISDEETAAREAEKKRKRQYEFNRIIKANLAGRDLLDAAESFSITYADDMTDEEKRCIGNTVFRYIETVPTSLMGSDEKDRWLMSNIRQYLCAPFIMDHLTDLPTNHNILGQWALGKIQSAISAADIPNHKKREACLRYRVSDGKNVTDCEIGRHNYVLVEEVTEENHEDYYHPHDYKVYRCEKCGYETREQVR